MLLPYNIYTRYSISRHTVPLRPQGKNKALVQRCCIVFGSGTDPIWLLILLLLLLLLRRRSSKRPKALSFQKLKSDRDKMMWLFFKYICINWLSRISDMTSYCDDGGLDVISLRKVLSSALLHAVWSAIVIIVVWLSVTKCIVHGAQSRCKGLKLLYRRVPSIFQTFCCRMYRLVTKPANVSARRKFKKLQRSDKRLHRSKAVWSCK